jgi:hypothetical protein
MNYPIYRKYKNNKEFARLNSDGVLLSVYKCRDNHYTIICSDSKHMVDNFLNHLNTDVITSVEFDAIYNEAQSFITKALTQQ